MTPEPFVPMHASTVKLCGGDANLAQIVEFVRFRQSWYESRARKYPDPTLVLEGDVVWAKVSIQEISIATGQTERSVSGRLNRLAAIGVLVRTQGLVDAYDRTYWYAVDEAMCDGRLADVMSCKRADRAVVKRADRAVVKRADRAVVPLLEDVEEGFEERAVVLQRVICDFDAFWDRYPRKAAKEAARGAWGKAIKKTTPAAIIAGAQRYAEDPNRVDEFTTHPATWLNQGRWEDEPLPARGGRTGKGMQGNVERLMGMGR